MRIKSNENVLILGAGISGIAASYYAKQYGINYGLYKAEKEVGGLINNFEINGFKFDKAVHFSFTNQAEVKKFFDKTPHYSHKPNAFCHL